MECRELHTLLLALASGELVGSSAEEAGQHLERCSGCRDLVQRERGFSSLLRARLGAGSPAPETLRERVREALVPPAPPPWAGRVFGSRWPPRFAFAVVLAVIVLIPILWAGRGTPALAKVAAARYSGHDPSAEGPLPPCCTALDVHPGDRLGPPSAGAVVPDLAAAGLEFVRATRCTFGDAPVNFLAYGGSGQRFSLYIADRGAREFKLLRHETHYGVPQARHAVALGADDKRPSSQVEVAMWLRRGLLFTWVGPASPLFEAGCGRLQGAP